MKHLIFASTVFLGRPGYRFIAGNSVLFGLGYNARCMRTCLLLLFVSATALAQTLSPIYEGTPRFDAQGHLSAYLYPDGTEDLYTYDGQWRMKRFIDRAGKVSVFIYAADGSVTVVNPDAITSTGAR